MSDVKPDDAPPAAAAPPGETGARPDRSPWPFVLTTLALLVAGWFLVNWMVETTRIQDCVMSGRRNCAPMDPALGR